MVPTRFVPRQCHDDSLLSRSNIVCMPSVAVRGMAEGEVSGQREHGVLGYLRN